MKNKRKGFSIVEVLVGIALIAIALIGLVQQEIDYLRSLTGPEMSTFPSTARGEFNDEQLDLNQDGTIDYRRVTQVQAQAAGTGYDVFVLVFPPSQLGATRSSLLLNPDNFKVKAQIHTVISR